MTAVAKTDKKFNKKDSEEVVRMEAKPGKVKQGKVVKLYYVTSEVIEASQALHENTPNVRKIIDKLPKRNKKIEEEE